MERARDLIPNLKLRYVIEAVLSDSFKFRPMKTDTFKFRPMKRKRSEDTEASEVK